MKEIKNFALVCKDIKERDSVVEKLRERFGNDLLEAVSLAYFPGDKNNFLTVRFWKEFSSWDKDRIIYIFFFTGLDESYFSKDEIITHQEFLDMIVEEKEFLITRTLNEF